MRRSVNSTNWRPWLKLAVGLVFLAMVLATAITQDLTARLKHVDLRYVLLSLAWSVAMISASCLKWTVLLRLQGHRLPFAGLLRIYFIGYYFTNLLPSNVGGDVARAYLAGRRIGNAGDAAVSVFVERFTGIVLLLILVIAAPLSRPGLYGHLRILLPALGAGALLLLFAWLGGRGSGAGGLKRWARLLQAQGDGRRWRGWLAGRLLWLATPLDRFRDGLTAAAAALRADAVLMAAVGALTVLFYVMTWVNVWLAFRVFETQASFAAIAAVVPTAMLIAMIPVSLGSLGLAEGVYVFYAGLMGVAPAEAALMGLFLRVKVLVSGCLGLLLHLRERRPRPGPATGPG